MRRPSSAGAAIPTNDDSSISMEIVSLQPTSDDQSNESSREWARRVVLVGLVILIGFVVYDSFHEKRVEQASKNFFSWVEGHPFLGVVAVVCAYIIATICFIPGSLLTIGTGFAFRSAFGSFAKGLVLASLVRKMDVHLWSVLLINIHFLLSL